MSTLRGRFMQTLSDGWFLVECVLYSPRYSTPVETSYRLPRAAIMVRFIWRLRKS